MKIHSLLYLLRLYWLENSDEKNVTNSSESRLLHGTVVQNHDLYEVKNHVNEPEEHKLKLLEQSHNKKHITGVIRSKKKNEPKTFFLDSIEKKNKYLRNGTGADFSSLQKPGLFLFDIFDNKTSSSQNQTNGYNQSGFSHLNINHSVENTHLKKNFLDHSLNKHQSIKLNKGHKSQKDDHYYSNNMQKHLAKVFKILALKNIEIRNKAKNNTFVQSKSLHSLQNHTRSKRKPGDGYYTISQENFFYDDENKNSSLDSLLNMTYNKTSNDYFPSIQNQTNENKVDKQLNSTFYEKPTYFLTYPGNQDFRNSNFTNLESDNPQKKHVNFLKLKKPQRSLNELQNINVTNFPEKSYSSPINQDFNLMKDVHTPKLIENNTLKIKYLNAINDFIVTETPTTRIFNLQGQILKTSKEMGNIQIPLSNQVQQNKENDIFNQLYLHNSPIDQITSKNKLKENPNTYELNQNIFANNALADLEKSKRIKKRETGGSNHKQYSSNKIRHQRKANQEFWSLTNENWYYHNNNNESKQLEHLKNNNYSANTLQNYLSEFGPSKNNINQTKLNTKHLNTNIMYKNGLNLNATITTTTVTIPYTSLTTKTPRYPELEKRSIENISMPSNVKLMTDLHSIIRLKRKAADSYWSKTHGKYWFKNKQPKMNGELPTYFQEWSSWNPNYNAYNFQYTNQDFSDKNKILTDTQTKEKDLKNNDKLQDQYNSYKPKKSTLSEVNIQVNGNPNNEIRSMEVGPTGNRYNVSFDEINLLNPSLNISRPHNIISGKENENYNSVIPENYSNYLTFNNFNSTTLGSNFQPIENPNLITNNNMKSLEEIPTGNWYNKSLDLLPFSAEFNLSNPYNSWENSNKQELSIENRDFRIHKKNIARPKRSEPIFLYNHSKNVLTQNDDSPIDIILFPNILSSFKNKYSLSKSSSSMSNQQHQSYNYKSHKKQLNKGTTYYPNTLQSDNDVEKYNSKSPQFSIIIHTQPPIQKDIQTVKRIGKKHDKLNSLFEKNERGSKHQALLNDFPLETNQRAQYFYLKDRLRPIMENNLALVANKQKITEDKIWLRKPNNDKNLNGTQIANINSKIVKKKRRRHHNYHHKPQKLQANTNRSLVVNKLNLSRLNPTYVKLLNQSLKNGLLVDQSFLKNQTNLIMNLTNIILPLLKSKSQNVVRQTKLNKRDAQGYWPMGNSYGMYSPYGNQLNPMAYGNQINPMGNPMGMGMGSMGMGNMGMGGMGLGMGNMGMSNALMSYFTDSSTNKGIMDNDEISNDVFKRNPSFYNDFNVVKNSTKYTGNLTNQHKSKRQIKTAELNTLLSDLRSEEDKKRFRRKPNPLQSMYVMKDPRYQSQKYSKSQNRGSHHHKLRIKRSIQNGHQKTNSKIFFGRHSFSKVKSKPYEETRGKSKSLMGNNTPKANFKWLKSYQKKSGKKPTKAKIKYQIAKRSAEFNNIKKKYISYLDYFNDDRARSYDYNSNNKHKRDVTSFHESRSDDNSEDSNPQLTGRAKTEEETGLSNNELPSSISSRSKPDSDGNSGTSNSGSGLAPSGSLDPVSDPGRGTDSIGGSGSDRGGNSGTSNSGSGSVPDRSQNSRSDTSIEPSGTGSSEEPLSMKFKERPLSVQQDSDSDRDYDEDFYHYEPDYGGNDSDNNSPQSNLPPLPDNINYAPVFKPPDYFRPEERLKKAPKTSQEYWMKYEYADVVNPDVYKPFNVTRNPAEFYEYYL